MAVIVILLLSQSAMAKLQRKNNTILKHSFGYNQQSKASVNIKALHQGCRVVDCIPAINNPRFASALEIAKKFALDDDDIVMLVDYNGVHKAYPLKIMQGHEIVNDSFLDKRLTVSYCPLCASAVAFIPQVAGEMVEFGVSGLLHNSDLVMYDRKTKSLWGQITGRAIMGPQTGQQLERVYVAQLRWAQAKANFPAVKVLLPPPGSRQDYQRNYYADYFKSNKTMFPVAINDRRLGQKTKVQGFIIDDQAFAIEVNYLAEQTALLVKVNGHQLNIVQKTDGTVLVKDLKTKQTYPPLMTFWFAWINFHPDSQLITQKEAKN